MLRPVLVRANYKITGATLVTLENILGANLPLLFPQVTVMNRTTSANSLTVSGQVRHLFTNQTDPDFNGAVLYSPFVDFSVGNGQVQVVPGLPNSLLPGSCGVTTELTLTNSGPAAEAWVSLVVRGMVETSVNPDPLLTINV